MKNISFRRRFVRMYSYEHGNLYAGDADLNDGEVIELIVPNDTGIALYTSEEFHAPPDTPPLGVQDGQADHT